MLLAYNELCALIEAGVINADYNNVNSSSIDLTLDSIIRVESTNEYSKQVIDLSAKESISTIERPLNSEGYILKPGEFILASSVEVFNLPNDISGEYKLKSTMARNGLEHLNAGWCDAGWNGSRLTLELVNVSRFHSLLLKPGMKIGQIVFFKHEAVPDDKSYAARGQYNGQNVVTAAKELI
jgi:dCTP deaminase